MNKGNIMKVLKNLLSLPVNEQVSMIINWCQRHQGLDEDAINELIFTCTYYDTVRIDYLRSVAASFHYAA